MTEEQYKKYTKINEEVQTLKNFLSWCGNKYKNKFTGKYPFKIDAKTKKFDLRSMLQFCSIPDNTYEISVELQSRIIETIEKYVGEKELEMESI